MIFTPPMPAAAMDHKPTGSALLIALVMMGILLTLSLGVSELLITTLQDNRIFTEKTKAWYAAESAQEQALFAVSENPPGFEMTQNKNLATNLSYEYRIQAKAQEIPFTPLLFNSSVAIPLFSGNRAEEKIKNFRVDYYLGPELKKLPTMQNSDELDILRWKIFGIDTIFKNMEVINEFVPANRGNSEQNPTCLGTPSNCYNAAKFYQKIVTPDGAAETQIIPLYPISEFLRTHVQNFLVLTNMVNIDLIAGTLSPEEKKKIATIRYRAVSEKNEPPFTLPFIKISSDGFAGNTKQSLDLEVKRDSFLPVFHYALYRTSE